MKLPYDHLIDTSEKRAHACMLLCLIITMIFFLPYVLLGFLLMTRDSYNSLFAMLSYPLLSSSYLSRIILDAISLTSYSISSLGKLLWENIGTMEILEGLVLMASYAIWIRKKKTTIVVALQLIEIIVCSLLVSVSLKSGSLSQAIGFLRIIGMIFVIVNTISIVICFIDFLQEAKAYKESLAYQVEEIKEHMED